VLDQVAEHKETWQRFCKAVHNKMGYASPPARGVNGGPSEAQLKYAAALAARNQLTIPGETLASGKALSAWIDKLVGKSPREDVASPGGCERIAVH
jgi:hypothetical protein